MARAGGRGAPSSPAPPHADPGGTPQRSYITEPGTHRTRRDASPTRRDVSCAECRPAWVCTPSVLPTYSRRGRVGDTDAAQRGWACRYQRSLAAGRVEPFPPPHGPARTCVGGRAAQRGHAYMRSSASRRGSAPGSSNTDSAHPPTTPPPYRYPLMIPAARAALRQRRQPRPPMAWRGPRCAQPGVGLSAPPSDV